MTDLPDPSDDRDAEAPEGLPSSLIPRWLALLVLTALLAAAGFSVWSLLAAEPPANPPAQERAADPLAP